MTFHPAPRCPGNGASGFMWITLTEGEQRLAQYISAARQAHNRRVGAVATPYGGKNVEQIGLESYGAELAFCRLHNVYPDFKTDEYGIEDAMLHDGRTVDVKCTNGRRLFVKAMKRPEICDLYAMMVCDWPRFRFAGWIEAFELFTDARLDQNLEHPAYVADERDLT